MLMDDSSGDSGSWRNGGNETDGSDGSRNGGDTQPGGSDGGDSYGDGFDGNGGGSSGGQRSSAGPSTVEKAVIVVSVAFTVALFTFAVWQVVMAPVADRPSAQVNEAHGKRRRTSRLRVAKRTERRPPLRDRRIPVYDAPSGSDVREHPRRWEAGWSDRLSPGTKDSNVSVSGWVEQ